MCYVVGFECFRCTRIVNVEECYLLFGRFYCRACEITITHDPSYQNILGIMKNVRPDIENN